MKRNEKQYMNRSRSLLELIDKSPTPFHVVNLFKDQLKSAGYVELHEYDEWNLSPNGQYFVIRNESSLVAFSIGLKMPEEAGFKIIGAHTDSPNLRLKPNPKYINKGYVQLGVEVYGGALLATWTDRDLSLAGRVIVRSLSNKKSSKSYLAKQRSFYSFLGNDCVSRLVKLNRPLLRIPQLAIHLNRSVNEKGLVLNPQSHLPPILSLADGKIKSKNLLKELVAKELKCKPVDIVGMDLQLFDLQKGTLGGLNNEFIFSSRLDNLASCHAAMAALLESPSRDLSTRILVFYDNEEIGSNTAQGGNSPFLKDVLERISSIEKKSRETFMRGIARSLFISADMAHAVHPNYAEMHDANHLPMINSGPVIKNHSGQKYATEGLSSAQFEQLCKKAKVAVQKFVIRSDLRCGSTIGPITATNLGVRTVDIGSPMLSMHSIREMAGSKDQENLVCVFKEFFKSE